MKLGIITDLHINAYENKNLDFKDFVANLTVDALVISGDLSSDNTLEDLEMAFKSIRDTDPYLDVIIVFGNHDCWTQDPFITLSELIKKREELCLKYNIHYLEKNKFETEEFVIYGFDGWYKFANPPTYDKNLMPQNAGFDSLTPNQLMQRREGKAVDYILDDLERTKNKKRILVTHFNLIYPPDKEMLAGNDRLLDLFSNDMDYIIFGHSHRYYKEKINRAMVLNVGAEYKKCPNSEEYFEIIKTDEM